MLNNIQFPFPTDSVLDAFVLEGSFYSPHCIATEFQQIDNFDCNN